jgi:hypothetical protein
MPSSVERKPRNSSAWLNPIILTIMCSVEHIMERFTIAKRILFRLERQRGEKRDYVLNCVRLCVAKWTEMDVAVIREEILIPKSFYHWLTDCDLLITTPASFSVSIHPCMIRKLSWKLNVSVRGGNEVLGRFREVSVKSHKRELWLLTWYTKPMERFWAETLYGSRNFEKVYSDVDVSGFNG